MAQRQRRRVPSSQHAYWLCCHRRGTNFRSRWRSRDYFPATVQERCIAGPCLHRTASHLRSAYNHRRCGDRHEHLSTWVRKTVVAVLRRVDNAAEDTGCLLVSRCCRRRFQPTYRYKTWTVQTLVVSTVCYRPSTWCSTSTVLLTAPAAHSISLLRSLIG